MNSITLNIYIRLYLLNHENKKAGCRFSQPKDKIEDYLYMSRFKSSINVCEGDSESVESRTLLTTVDIERNSIDGLLGRMPK